MQKGRGALPAGGAAVQRRRRLACRAAPVQPALQLRSPILSRECQAALDHAAAWRRRRQAALLPPLLLDRQWPPRPPAQNTAAPAAGLAQNRYFEDEAFLEYLKYLLYWQQPQYARFVV